jgi:hypothetical protein
MSALSNATEISLKCMALKFLGLCLFIFFLPFLVQCIPRSLDNLTFFNSKAFSQKSIYFPLFCLSVHFGNTILLYDKNLASISQPPRKNEVNYAIDFAI